MTLLSSPSLTTAAAGPFRAMEQQVRFWDRAARKYAASQIADPGGYEHSLARTQALLAPNFDVLEVGCGTGSTALRLAPAVRRWVATDVSGEMIAIAREKLAAQRMPQLRFEVAAAGAPVVAAASQDVVTAFNVLHLVPDLDRTLAAIAALIRPGGLFISKTACLSEMNPLIARVAVPLMRAIGKAPPVLSFDGRQLAAAIERHGLVVEALERHGTTRRDPRAFIIARKPA